MARTYKRDSRGRFASGSGGSARSAPKVRVVTGARAVSGGKNRLTRNNAGRITSVGGQGATGRGGRLRTASGAKRQTVVVKMKLQNASGVRSGAGVTKKGGGVTLRNWWGAKSGLKKRIGGSVPRISRAEPLALPGGTLAARSSLTRSRRKLEQNPSAAQRGAVTRAKKFAAAARVRDTTAKKFGRPASVMRKRPPESPLRWQVKAPKGGDAAPTRAKGSRIRLARPAGTIAKPKEIKARPIKQSRVPASQRPGSITSTLRGTLRSLAKADAQRIREVEAITGQKGAVTRTGKAAKAARMENRRTLTTKRSNVIAKPTGLKPGALAARRSATDSKAAQASRSKAFSSKAAPNKAKAAYQAARSRAREASMLAGGRTSTRGLGNRTDAGAQSIRANVKVAQAAAARVRAMEKNRGRKRTSKTR